MSDLSGYQPIERKIKTFGWILLFVVLAYFPISLFLFAVKNDFFTGYFPGRHFLSSCLKQGFLPVWNPYINYGIPAYGDITSGFWNPLTILIAWIPGYNAWTMTLELMAYLVIAAGGAYALCRHFRISQLFAFISSASYATCGYMTGHLQHINWIAGAALLPWCSLALIRIWQGFSWRRFAACLFTISFFIASAHPGIVIGSLYFFAFLGMGVLLRSAPSRSAATIMLMKTSLAAFIAVVLVLSGMLYALSDALPMMTRGLNSQLSITEGISPIKSWLTLFLPATGKAGWLAGTDPSIQNTHIGLLVCAACIALAIRGPRWIRSILIANTFFFLMASAGYLSFLPFLDLVRLPGEFRIFVMLPLIIAGGWHLDECFRAGYEKNDWVARILGILTWVLAGVMFAAGFDFLSGPQDLSSSRPEGFGFRSYLKDYIDNIPASLLLAQQAFLGASTCFLIRNAWIRRAPKLILTFSVIGLTLTCLSTQPFTGVGRRSPSDVQALIDQSPRGFPMPATDVGKVITGKYPLTDSVIGNWSLYSREIATDRLVPYPALLRSTEQLFDQGLNRQLQDQAFLMQSPNLEPFTIKTIDFSPGKINVEVSSDSVSSIKLKQAAFHRWKAVGKPSLPLQLQSQNGLIAIKLSAGIRQVHLFFVGRDIRFAWWWHMSIFFLIACFLLIPRFKKQ